MLRLEVRCKRVVSQHTDNPFVQPSPLIHFTELTYTREMINDDKSPNIPIEDGDAAKRTSFRWGKVGGLLIVMAIIAVVCYQFGDRLSLSYFAEREVQLRQWKSSAPVLTAAVAVAICVAVTGLSLPSAAVLTLVCGWYFGFWDGLAVASSGSTMGATMSFLLSRYFFRDWVQSSMQSRLVGINAALNREGAFYLFTLRLIPIVPFFVVNAVMGLTNIRAMTFAWVSLIGTLPGTAVYVYAGSTVPSLQVLAKDGIGKILSWQLILAIVLLGFFPLVMKKLLTLFSNQQIAHENP